MIKVVKVTELKPVDGRALWLRFSDGREGLRDCADILALDGEMVAPLRDPTMFSHAFLSMGVPTWPNGFDLDPINLHAEMLAAGSLKRASAA